MATWQGRGPLRDRRSCRICCAGFLRPQMTDTHVVSALKTKRIQVASQIESLQDWRFPE